MILGVCSATIVEYVKKGILPGRFEGVGRRVRVRLEDVVRLRDSWNVRPPQPDYKSAAANDQD